MNKSQGLNSKNSRRLPVGLQASSHTIRAEMNADITEVDLGGDIDSAKGKDDTVKIDVKSLQYSEANKIWKCGNGRTLKQKEQKVVYMLYHPVHKTFVFSEKTG